MRTTVTRLSRILSAALLLSLLSVLPASAQVGRDPAPSPTAAKIETEFLTGMIPHHRSAIMMAEMALEKSAQPEIRDLARQIVTSQDGEIAEMTTWLRDWYGMAAPAGMEMPMSAMMEMMPMMHGAMPDMMMGMDRLKGLSGAEFDVEFLSAMIDHHAMAIGMAMPVLVGGHHADLYRLTESIVISQGEEIRTMRTALDTLYGVERPVEGPPMSMNHGG